MGLIRSGNTSLTTLSDEVDLTNYLWPIVREMIKTAIENNQNLIIEGCYIPFDWKKDFDERYINNIKEVWLIFSTNYIENNFDKILKFANVIEQRLDDSDLSMDSLIEDNKRILDGCISFNLNYVLIDDEYNILDSII
jgi:hypothetical protein